jgi:hypothetical protein
MDFIAASLLNNRCVADLRLIYAGVFQGIANGIGARFLPPAHEPI